MKTRLAIEFAKKRLEKVGTIVEVGVGSCVHALSMYDTLKPKSMYLVDPFFVPDNWPEHEKAYANAECQLNLHKTVSFVKDYKNMFFVNLESHMAPNLVPDGLDVVYIDAIHDFFNVTRDIQNWYPKIRIGGILCGHDYYHPEVKRAVHKCLPEFDTLTEYNSENPFNAQASDWWIVKDKDREWINV